MEETRNACKIKSQSTNGRCHLGNLDKDGKILKWILKKEGVMTWYLRLGISCGFL
jgi:hypothetical protein